MRSLLLLASLLCVFLASAALAAESAIVEGAKKEGASVFYTTMDIQNSKPLLDPLSGGTPSSKAISFDWAARRWSAS